MKCEKCGTEVKKGDKFCPDCGAEVSGASESQGAKSSTKPVFPKKIIFWVLAVVVIVILSIVFPIFLVIAIPLLLFAIVLTVCLKLWRKKKNRDSQEVEQQTLSDKETQKLAQYFVSRDEKFISSLGNGYIMNYLINGSFSKGFSIITNKRVYFRGSCFSGQGKALVKTNEERTVDIKDITGSGFIYKRYIGILLGLITAFLVFAAGVPEMGYRTRYSWRDYQAWRQMAEEYQQKAEEYQQAAERQSDQYYAKEYQREAEEAQQRAEEYRQEVATIASILGLCLSLAVTCILIFLDYLMRRKTFFQIQYAGGCIAFNVSYYAKAEIDDFQKQLRRAKDLAEESASKAPVIETPVQPAAAAQNSVPDDLRKYADLLKEGLISQEEYDAMKKKILGLV
ncbi:MAG: SHOCT domain-containing protein [bacterium]|nr:SHOCT domain-containing protein [bacterium]